jgi:hypothetical protein
MVHVFTIGLWGFLWCIFPAIQWVESVEDWPKELYKGCLRIWLVGIHHDDSECFILD